MPIRVYRAAGPPLPQIDGHRTVDQRGVSEAEPTRLEPAEIAGGARASHRGSRRWDAHGSRAHGTRHCGRDSSCLAPAHTALATRTRQPRQCTALSCQQHAICACTAAGPARYGLRLALTLKSRTLSVNSLGSRECCAHGACRAKPKIAIVLPRFFSILVLNFTPGPAAAF